MGAQGHHDLKKLLSMDNKYKNSKEVALRYNHKVY